MLSIREKQVLEAIEYFIKDKGISPTLEMIAYHLDYSNRSSVSRFVSSLEEKGYIKKPQGRKKSIQLVDEGSQYQLPLIGKIAAGVPLEACEVVRHINLQNLFDTPEQFFFEISGDSMQDIGIVDGDYVLMKRQQVAKQGSIVAAIVDDGEATLKAYYYNDDNTVTLQAYNNKYKDMMYPAERVNIFAIYTGARFDPRIFNNH